MTDWLDKFTPAEREDWEAWVKDVDEELYPRLSRSNAFISLCPVTGKPDAKFCVELGMAIMLDKPVIVVVAPGSVLPKKLNRVADRVIVADITTGEGQALVAQELKVAIDDLVKDE
jgi:hypothetical protein